MKKQYFGQNGDLNRRGKEHYGRIYNPVTRKQKKVKRSSRVMDQMKNRAKLKENFKRGIFSVEDFERYVFDEI